MAFTAEQQLSISKIVGVTPSRLAAHLASMGADLTAARESAVIAEIERWEAGGIGSKHVKIHPKESNMGVETDSGHAKAEIQRNIAVLLELPVYVAGAGASGSMGTIRIGSSSSGC